MTRASISIVQSLCLVCASFAQAQEAESIGGTQLHALPAATDELHSLTTERDRANRLTVQVMVNDQGPFEFLLDTGANQSVVTARLAKRLNLEMSSTANTKLRGITGEAMVSRVRIAKLQAGSLLLTNRSLAVIDAAVPGLDGVLGVDGFRNKRLAVHVAGKKVTIGRSSPHEPAPEYAVFPVQYRHGLLVLVPASVPGTSLKAVIDTGSAATLGNTPLRKAITARAYGRAAQTTRIQGVTGAIQHGETEWASVIRLESWRAGTYEALLIRDIPVAYGDFYVFELWNLTREPALIVGMNVLNHLDEFIIDYGRKELLMKERKAVFADLRAMSRR